MMARTRTQAREAVDFGPARLIVKGRRQVSLAPDPDNANRTVLRANVRVVYQDWWASGLISHAQREAADRLAVQFEVVQGASGTGSEGGRQHGSQRSVPPLRMLQAAEDLREARAAVGADNWDSVVAVVVLNHDRCSAMISKQLEKLVVLWGME